MSLPSQKYKPARMVLTNLATAEPLEAQFNPTELEESIQVNWNKLGILGLSHMPKQYQQTDNQSFSFELAFRAMDDNGNRLSYIVEARKFLLALTVPPRSGSGIVGGSPPRVLFAWPRIISLTSTIDKLTFKHTLFNRTGIMINFSVKVEISEIRDTRMFSEDVRLTGTNRGP